MRPLALLALFVMLTTSSFSQTAERDTLIEVEDKLFQRVEVEAAYPGGADAWIQYLMRNVNGGVATDNGAPIGVYTVVVQFIVEKDGTLSDFKALTKHGYGMEQEVLKILRTSGLWTPAMQGGRPVRAYRKQPVTFQVQDDDISIHTATPYTLFTHTDNTVSITVKKIKPEDLRLTISQGSIIDKGNGDYIVKATRPGKAIVRIYNKKDKELGVIGFEVKDK